ncbi:MAG: hypothetical protein ACK2T3_03385 [Candidatus Promineifilaceae bacterium]|jgi:hypothetical protein
METNKEDELKSGELSPDLLDIHADDVDQDELISRVADGLAKRREQYGEFDIRFPSYEGSAYPGIPENGPFDADLHHHLKMVNEEYLDVEMGANLALSPAARIPIIGGLWRLIRAQAHELVLFYVNRSVRHNIRVNGHFVTILNSLTRSNDELQQRVLQLEKDLEEMRSRAV